GVLAGRRKPPGRERPAADKPLNQSTSTLRAAMKRAIAHLKDWKIPATRYRGPLETLPSIVRTITTLAFFSLTQSGILEFRGAAAWSTGMLG
ncbi:hypothetical protein ACWCQZ_51475, partial [Streptomyces sp. NPDC002285]